jgi:hypothetical protein
LRVLDWKMLIYFMNIWNILQTFGIFYDHFVQFGFHMVPFPVLASCTKKNLATPGQSHKSQVIEVDQFMTKKKKITYTLDQITCEISIERYWKSILGLCRISSHGLLFNELFYLK